VAAGTPEQVPKHPAAHRPLPQKSAGPTLPAVAGRRSEPRPSAAALNGKEAIALNPRGLEGSALASTLKFILAGLLAFDSRKTGTETCGLCDRLDSLLSLNHLEVEHR